ncbi:MAG: response regulator [Candidatus Contendobacter sp.]|jgi:DNA-binding NtrC family response regulator|nr:response regulator [Gammaproteobacteria bacterium]MCC8994878.1 response regulator [Candidatus Contendobacter sp.]
MVTMLDWVLIVDDEAMIRENLKAYLEDEGLRVAAFEAVTPALDWLGERSPCRVCIMDMRLPDMDGNSAIRILHQRYPQMAFLIHTGSSSYSLPDDLRAMGLDERCVYHKPLTDMGPLATAVRARLLPGEGQP